MTCGPAATVSPVWNASGTTPPAGRRALRAPGPARARRRADRRLDRARCACSRPATRRRSTCRPPTSARDLLTASNARSTWCEFKGAARYFDAAVGERRVHAVAWSFSDPTPGYEALRDHLAFYPGRVDAAWLDDEQVHAQEGDFYGGWITADLVGPFKGPPGTLGW